MDIDQLKNIAKNTHNEFKEEIKSLDIDEVYIKYLGKKGKINSLFKELKEQYPDSIAEVAKEVNRVKSSINEEITKHREEGNESEIEKDDLTIPVTPTKTGNLHPITIVKRQLYQFFHYYGFSVYYGPEIETDYYNFEMLGVSKDHPARELQDTLYILEPEYLLRTQTSSIESRILEQQEPPIRFVSGDTSFRNETENRSNSSFFHQLQGVYVDRNVTMGHLKWMFTKSLKYILGEDTQIRFRAKYYPEVEPGMSPDVMCSFCKGDGCEICKKRGWIEIAGGGMIHSKTLEKAGIDPSEYSGFAFGWGLDRIAMANHNITDIRSLFNGSIVYK